VGHPVIHVGNVWKDMEACMHMDGLIVCTIVPPEKLYHPVLLFRCNKNVMFCLCRTCVPTSSTGEFVHTTVEERVLKFTWVLDEDRLAVDKGYKILVI